MKSGANEVLRQYVLVHSLDPIMFSVWAFYPLHTVSHGDDTV